VRSNLCRDGLVSDRLEFAAAKRSAPGGAARALGSPNERNRKRLLTAARSKARGVRNAGTVWVCLVTAAHGFGTSP
jgi:hypothetical protein